jgi:hypothetical protein
MLIFMAPMQLHPIANLILPCAFVRIYATFSFVSMYPTSISVERTFSCMQ